MSDRPLTPEDLADVLAVVMVETVKGIVQSSKASDDALEDIAGSLLNFSNGPVGGPPAEALRALAKKLIKTEIGSGIR